MREAIRSTLELPLLPPPQLLEAVPSRIFSSHLLPLPVHCKARFISCQSSSSPLPPIRMSGPRTYVPACVCSTKACSKTACPPHPFLSVGSPSIILRCVQGLAPLCLQPSPNCPVFGCPPSPPPCRAMLTRRTPLSPPLHLAHLTGVRLFPHLERRPWHKIPKLCHRHRSTRLPSTARQPAPDRPRLARAKALQFSDPASSPPAGKRAQGTTRQALTREPVAAILPLHTCLHLHLETLDDITHWPGPRQAAPSSGLPSPSITSGAKFL
ncbi:hypothetical protein EV126DRAFT_104972 [Verticillium dahliae]|nr:hypothetical protein EV126DRAFT_104972 [Verticillium dahliae]